MKRFLVVLLLVPLSAAARGEFNVVEASIMDMQQAMASGRVTSRPAAKVGATTSTPSPDRLKEGLNG